MDGLDMHLARLVEHATRRAVSEALAEHSQRADVEGHGELLVSVEEAGRRLDVSRETVYRLIADGELDVVDGIGRGRKVVVASMRGLVDQLRNQRSVA